MTDEDARRLVASILHQVAPESDLSDVPRAQTLQEALDLDSMDFLNFVVGLRDATGLDIAERDYPQLTTLDGCVSYLKGCNLGQMRSP